MFAEKEGREVLRVVRTVGAELVGLRAFLVDISPVRRSKDLFSLGGSGKWGSKLMYAADFFGPKTLGGRQMGLSSRSDKLLAPHHRRSLAESRRSVTQSRANGRERWRGHGTTGSAQASAVCNGPQAHCAVAHSHHRKEAVLGWRTLRLLDGRFPERLPPCSPPSLVSIFAVLRVPRVFFAQEGKQPGQQGGPHLIECRRSTLELRQKKRQWKPAGSTDQWARQGGGGHCVDVQFFPIPLACTPSPCLDTLQTAWQRKGCSAKLHRLSSTLPYLSSKSPYLNVKRDRSPFSV